MAANKIDARQSRLTSAQSMLGSSAGDTLDTIFPKINDELAKHFEDRNILLTDGGIITFTGTQLQFTENLNIVINQKISGASPQIISLGSSNVDLNNNEMWYAVINRTAGTATTAVASTLPSASSANQEIFLIVKRVDAGDSTQRLYFRNGSALNAGQSVRLGASGSGSGGSGTGDDLAALTFKASFTDNFDDIPSATNSAVDITTGKTDSTLYSAVNALFQLNYDASKTVTGTGTSMTLSGTPSFTVKQGDMLVVGTQARRIVTVNTQTSYVIESSFTTDPSAAQATVSQAVYSKDLNNFSGDGLPVSTAFSTSINQIMAVYEDTSTVGDKIFDANTTPVIAFSASSDGSSYCDVQKRATNLSDTVSYVNLPTSGTNLYLRFFANKTSGSGTVNVLGYKVFFHRDLSYLDGSTLNQAYCFTDGTGTEINCSAPGLVSGKTRLTLNWSYPIGVNSGTTNGSLSVYLNGQKIPRYVDSVITPDAFYKEIDAKTIELDSDYSANNFSLEVVQDVAVVDASDTNVTAISQIQESSLEGFQGFVKTSTKINPTTTIGSPAAGTFYSSIINRAPIADLTQNLKAHMGVERVMTQQIYQMQNEFGPNGELVFASPNDERVRFVGSWTLSLGINGSQMIPSSANDYIEVTFYGTGLNIFARVNGSGFDVYSSVDGGSETNIIAAATNYSGALSGRNYATNQVFSAVSNLSLGVHTVKIRNAANLVFYGFEILNESSLVKVNPGSSYIQGKKYTTNSQQALAYNSSFESGTLGTKGGRVVVYQKADGSIAKAVQPVDTSSATLSSTDHTNEEVARTYHVNEFGAGRSDDFSFATGTIDKGFTLDDGTTTLVGNSVNRTGAGTAKEIIAIGALNGFFTFMFVGTGLDLIRADGTSGTLDQHTIYVNGTSIGTITGSGSVDTKTMKIVSGLPYGTHVVKITRDAAVNNPISVKQFIVYQPKKPTVPSGSVELADYNIMANFVPNTVASINTISTGVLRKAPSREFTYVQGTGGATDWTVALDVTSVMSNRVYTDRGSAYFEYTFFGTGFDFRSICYASMSGNISVTINGLAFTSANFSGVTCSTYGTGVTYGGSSGSSFGLPASNTLDFNDVSNTPGSGFRASGLALGKYTIRMTNNSAGGVWRIDAFDIITPIHSHKSNIYADLQNTLPVGSCGISDNRNISPIKDVNLQKKNWVQAFGITNNPTNSSTSLIPIPDMSVAIKTTNNQIKIAYSVTAYQNGAAQYIAYQVFVDGVAQGFLKYDTHAASGQDHTVSDTLMVTVSPGVHKVDLHWKVGSGTATSTNVSRNLLVEEV